MGYFGDQEGIMRRYIREIDQWKSHLENTRKAILKFASNKRKNKVAILGSGWLLDVPLNELSETFKEVWLFDIKHPSPVYRKAEKLGNVRLVETDVSGFAIPVFGLVKNSKKSGSKLDINSLLPKFDFNLEGFDFVVSCNMLNQLDIILIDYLKKECKIAASDESQLRRFIQETHMNLLPKNKSCLISDVEEQWVDSDGQIQQQKSLVYTDKLSANMKESWIWHFDNYFTYNTKYKTWFNVICIDC